MARDTKWSDDLAALAEGERQSLGAPPSVEQLIALRDGELPVEQAEKIRDWLAVDSELAAVYLELKRGVDVERFTTGSPGEEISDPEVDDAWSELSSRLDQEPSIAVDPAYDADEVVPFRRGWRGTFALAATLIFSVGLVWFLAQSRQPEPKTHDVRITNDLFRDTSLSVPADAVDISFQIELPALDDEGVFIVELLDSSGQVVRRERSTAEGGQPQIDFRVRSSTLEEGRGYRLVVRSVDAVLTDSPVIDVAFKPVFETTPRTGGMAAPDSCAEFDPLIKAAVELRRDGQWQAAETSYNHLLVRTRANGCAFREARVWNALATVAILEGRLIDGLRLLHRAEDRLSVSASAGLEEVAEEDERGLRANIELSRGVAYSNLGQLEEAEQKFQQTQAIYRQIDATSGHHASLQLQFARLYRFQGKYDQAREAVRQALARETDGWTRRASLWQESARIALKNGQLEAAESALHKAIAAVESQDGEVAKANVYVDLAELRARQDRWQESLQWVGKTLDLIEAAKRPDLNLEAFVRHVQSLALAGLGDLDGAQRASDHGLALLEAARGVWRDQGLQFFARRQELYRHRLGLAAAAGDRQAAWEVFEGSRAQSLLENESARLRRPESRPPQDVIDKIVQARRDLLDAVRQLDEWEPSQGDTAKELYQLYRARFLSRRNTLRELQDAEQQAAGLRSPPEASLADAHGLLDSGTLGLIFTTSTDGLHILILSQQHSLEILSLDANLQQIQKLVAGVLESLDPRAAKKLRAGLESRVQELSQILLFPLQEHLADFTRLAIVAGGSLERLPFEILRHPGTGHHLLESHEIAYLPSFSVLGALRQRAGRCSSPESELLVMGDPLFGSRDPRWPGDVADRRNSEDILAFQRLEGTATEVTRIARDAGTEPILGAAATRELFLNEAPRNQVVHVASHAWSDAHAPERSRILLSCVDPADNSAETCDLYFADVLTLELCGQTVVLSACKTAGGLAIEGEGILGLPWAFLRAGASTVVASLWQVADDATAELMSNFHRHLREGMGPAGALRLAKLASIGRGDHPSTWAAFVLLGDWRSSSSTFSRRSGPIP